MTYQRLLFIGDSITEWGRFEDESNIGENYVRMIRDQLAIQEPHHFPVIINRGISGNRITDLVDRWQKDVIDHKPDLISISIGVNDVWRQLDNPEIAQVSPDHFRTQYEQLIETTLAALDTTIVLMEPTIIEETVEAEGNQRLQAYVNVVHQLAEHYQLTVVPTHQAFLRYLKSDNRIPLTIDGVHMSSTGDALMAKTWLETVKI